MASEFRVLVALPCRTAEAALFWNDSAGMPHLWTSGLDLGGGALCLEGQFGVDEFDRNFVGGFSYCGLWG